MFLKPFYLNNYSTEEKNGKKGYDNPEMVIFMNLPVFNALTRWIDLYNI